MTKRRVFTGLVYWLAMFSVATWPNLSGDRRLLALAGWLLVATVSYALGLMVFRRTHSRTRDTT